MGRVTTREVVLKLGASGSANAGASGSADGAAGTVNAAGGIRARDTLAAEEPLEIRIAGRQIAVTMRTPGDDFDLVAGYLVGEGVIRSPEQLARMRFCGDSACAGPIGLPTELGESAGTTSVLNLLGHEAVPARIGDEHGAAPARIESAHAAALGQTKFAHEVAQGRIESAHETAEGRVESRHDAAPQLAGGRHEAPGLVGAGVPGPVGGGHGGAPGRIESAHDAYNIIDVDLAPGTALPLWSLDRTTYTTSACGVCGKSSIEAVRANAHWRVDSDSVRISPQILYSLPKTLRAGQKLFAKTGGLHAAGLFTSDGELLCVREDVGRHNAVDKVIGWALRADRLPLRGHLLAVSGRASFELVQKAAAAGIPVLAAVSAPSSLAVELARAAGMTLAGFVRGESANVYAGTERISLASSDSPAR